MPGRLGSWRIEELSIRQGSQTWNAVKHSTGAWVAEVQLEDGRSIIECRGIDENEKPFSSALGVLVSTASQETQSL